MPMPSYTPDQVAMAFINEGRRRKITPRGQVIAIATGLVESGLKVYSNDKVPESLDICPQCPVSHDGRSVGPLQQQVVMGNGWWWGDAATCMDPTKSVGLFYDRLVKLDYNNPNQSPGSFAQAIQQSAFPDRYDQRMGDAQAIYNRLASGDVVVPAPAPAPAVDPNRPDFNEYWRESDNSQDRGDTKIDLWVLHTQEADGNADSLASFLIGSADGPNPVSYHYTLSWNSSDDGVTVCDVVDTDLASWSVGNSNNRAINLCFAGSRAGWNRQQWLDNVGQRGIDVAAYLCVADCVKYGITPKVIPPPYTSDPPGIADHRYCGQRLRDGNNHTDVGDGFPWDVFTAAVAKYWALAHQQPDTPTKPVEPIPTPPAPPTGPLTDDEMRELLAKTRAVYDQLCGPNGGGWPQLGTSADAVTALEARVANGGPLYPVDVLAWLKHHVTTRKTPRA